jgi:hypothetical protein
MSSEPPPVVHERLHFELEVAPPAPGSAWHATLLVPASGVRTEFDTPVALLRYLVQATWTDRQGGLR